MFFLDFWNDVGEAIIDAIRSLMLSICEIVYKLIVFFFDIFMILGNGSLLSNSTIQEIYQRVGLILGLFMIFRVTFSLIQYVMNPDMMVDRQKGLFNIVKKIFIVVILLGITPSIFKMAYDVQKLVVNSNIIPKVITGKNIDTKDSGTNLALNSFESFYKFSEQAITLFGERDVQEMCPELATPIIRNDFVENNTLRYAYNCVNSKLPYTDSYGRVSNVYIIDFEGNGVVPAIVGLIILWMILMYVIQVGIRVVQLSYLQLIAPIPIIMHLAPGGEDKLNKWFKQCTTTYFDFFIRIAIIYFVIFIVNLLSSADGQHFINSLGEVSDVDLTFITIIMILALLIFAGRIPKLFKELFPSSGGAASFDFGLSPKKVFNDTLAARAIGAVGGAVGAGASNAIHGYMNMRKAFKNNGGVTSGEAWKAAGSAFFKGTASVAGGILGGARAGLRTKDITKVGDAVKTANKNRQEREFKAEAGYHWYNPLPVIEDKILEFSGDRTAEEVKNRQKAMVESKKWDERLRKGEQIYKFVDGDLEDKTSHKVKSGVFKHSEYIETWNNQNLAKSEVKEAKNVFEQMQRATTAAYSDFSGTEEERKYRIEVAEKRLSNAAKNLSAAEGKLEIAKGKHKKNQELFSDDKEIEDLFGEYSSTHKESVDINKGVNDINNPNGSQTNAGEEEFNDGQISFDEFMNIDQEVSDANMEVANAIAKNPGTAVVSEAREKFVSADQARDEAMEKIANMNTSNTVDTNIPNVSVNTSGLSKAELRKIKNELEKRYRELDRQYSKLENQSMNGQTIDTAQLSRIKAERQAISKELEKVYIELNK